MRVGKYGEGRKRRLVIIELGAIASVISAVATVIGLIYGIHNVLLGADCHGLYQTHYYYSAERQSKSIN